ncbi:hypothetical protein ACEVQ6_23585, partial [Ciceribacter sp. sgz301302]
MDFEASTVFTRWPDAPEIDEGAHGYRLRLVKANGMLSVTTFNIFNQITTDTADPDGSLKLLERHPIPEEWKARLRAATQVRDGRKVALAGQLFSYKQVVKGARRFCPGCIAEHAYHRNLSDISACETKLVELRREDFRLIVALS